MAEKGWNAKGLLQPLWSRYPGGRDALAKDVGSTGNSLSARNTGTRNLGEDLGRRLAAALGVSLLELGAPEDLPDPRGQTLLDRLEGLGEKVEYLLGRETDLSERVALLETGRRRSPNAAKRPGTS